MARTGTTYGEILIEEYEKMLKNINYYNSKNCDKSDIELLKGARNIIDRTVYVIYCKLGIVVEFPNTGVRHGIIKCGRPMYSSPDGKTLRECDIRDYIFRGPKHFEGFSINLGYPKPLGIIETSMIHTRNM